jgi:N-acetylglutamate synthase-like GNAT family acetyltransferase
LHNNIEIEPPEPKEWADYRSLLVEAGLPPDGLEESVALVARHGRRVVGGAALEPYGSEALLRSVVVDKRLRGAGLGRALVRAAVEVGEEHGVRGIYLLTESAAGYFQDLGFAATPRRDVPESVQGSVQFRSACPKSAVVMTARIEQLKAQAERGNG